MNNHFLREPSLTSSLTINDSILTAGVGDRLLGAPAILTAAETATVARDIRTVYDLARALPDRLFGGNVAALASAVGYSKEQAEFFGGFTTTGQLAPLARADLYHDGTAFRLLELNVTSALGGYEIARLNRLLLEHEPWRAYVSERRLQYQDPMEAVARVLITECASGSDPDAIFGVVDIAQNIPPVGGALRGLASILSELGVESRACHPGELTDTNGKLSIAGRQIRGLLRHFPLEDYFDSAFAEELSLVVSATKAGSVGMCSRLDAELYGNKGLLAMMSEHLHSHELTEAERSCVERFLPWTRFVTTRTTDPGGSPVDLFRYAIANQNNLILKPTHLYGGKGIVAGWETTPSQWLSELETAVDGPFVMQERVLPVLEEYPGTSGDTGESVILNWGIYVADEALVGNGGYAGGMIRATQDRDVGVLSHSNGAFIGCVFHEYLRGE